MTKAAIVVGGGMAGIAAALRLQERGEELLLVEKRAFLGGRATSFVDPVTGDVIDNAQHILLGCCTNVLALLASLGQGSELDWYHDFHYLASDGRRHDLKRGALPAPLHFGPALLGFGALPLADRLRIARAFAVLMMTSAEQLESWRSRSILAWLEARGQSALAIARFWRPIIVSAVNEELDVAAALPALQVFLEGFLPHREAASLAVPRVGLEELFARPAAIALERAGSRVRDRMRLDEIVVEGDRLLALRFAGGEEIPCDRAVLALPPEALARIQVSDGAPLVAGGLLESFEGSPILGLHLWFDREVLDLPQVALLDARLEWIFGKEPGAKAREMGARQRIQGVFSAGRDLLRTSQRAIIEQSLEEMRRVLPAMAEARLVHGTVVKELRATMVLDPRTDERRPGNETRIRGLALAGDWTRTGWPATLEGACRSGRMAAATLLGEPVEDALDPDLERGGLARLLMARAPLKAGRSRT